MFALLTVIWSCLPMPGARSPRWPARSESGQVVNEWLGLSALGIVAIVAIGAGLRLLGLDVIEWIRAQLVP